MLPTKMMAPIVSAALVCACNAEPTPSAAASGAAAPVVENAAAPTSEQATPAARPQPSTSEPPSPVLKGIPSKIPPPPPGAKTAPLAVGAKVTYVCENGMPLMASFEGPLAHVEWVSGETLTLTGAVATAGQPETYEGGGYTLRRVANVIELMQQGGQSWRCSESEATA